MPDTSGGRAPAPCGGAGPASELRDRYSTLTPPVAGTSVNTPTYYLISSLSGTFTVNPILRFPGPAATYVAIRVVGGDITEKYGEREGQ